MALFTVLLAGCQATLADLDPASLEAAPTFTRDVLPLYEKYCIDCHTRGARMDGGVALDVYVAAHSTRVRSACVSIGTDVINEYGAWLLPEAGYGSPVPCEPWVPLSMPPGATPRLTLGEQVTLARWVAAGAPE